MRPGVPSAVKVNSGSGTTNGADVGGRSVKGSFKASGRVPSTAWNGGCGDTKHDPWLGDPSKFAP